jgi:hypothetical protein
VTDPPPVESDGGTSSDYSGASADYSGASSGDPNAPAPPPAEPAPAASAPYVAGSGDVYLYPRNGQSDAQAQNDRYECHSWAVNQTGFDPTRPSQQGTAAGYRRAMIACLDARGYSAR